MARERERGFAYCPAAAKSKAFSLEALNFFAGCDMLAEVLSEGGCLVAVVNDCRMDAGCRYLVCMYNYPKLRMWIETGLGASESRPATPAAPAILIRKCV